MAENRKTVPEIANIQVLVARYGDRTPHMLSAERPVEEQLEQLARDFGEKHVTVNGEPYAKFAEEYDLERRGDAELPLRAGMAIVAGEDPDERLEANREAGVHNAEDHVGSILPTVSQAEDDARKAEEARRRQNENNDLAAALKRDEERKRNEQTRVPSEVADQLTKQTAEQAGLGTGGQGSGQDLRETADRQEEKSDAELEQLIADAEARGDTESVDEIRRYQAMTNEERRANRPIVDNDGKVRVASRDPNVLANEPPAPPAKDQMRKDLASDPTDSRSKPPVQGETTDQPERRDVEQMSKADLKAELDEYGAGYETDANKKALAKRVEEERAKRLPK